MDPEVQEIPIIPDVVVLDSDDPVPTKDPVPAPRRDDPLENLEKALENACGTITSFAASLINFSYESQDLLYTKACVFSTVLRLPFFNPCPIAYRPCFLFSSCNALRARRNEFVKDLREIDEKAKAVDAVIPLEVIEAIDKGRNPEHCTYQMLYVFPPFIALP